MLQGLVSDGDPMTERPLHLRSLASTTTSRLWMNGPSSPINNPYQRPQLPDTPHAQHLQAS
jgi:hypothetical protein